MERFLDMHMYITSALQKTDMKAVGLQLALDLLHKKVPLTFFIDCFKHTFFIWTILSSTSSPLGLLSGGTAFLVWVAQPRLKHTF